jgi:hypothetical protein
MITILIVLEYMEYISLRKADIISIISSKGQTKQQHEDLVENLR